MRGESQRRHDEAERRLHDQQESAARDLEVANENQKELEHKVASLMAKLEEATEAEEALSRTLDESRREAVAAMEKATSGTGKEMEEMEALLSAARDEGAKLKMEMNLAVEAQERLQKQADEAGQRARAMEARVVEFEGVKRHSQEYPEQTYTHAHPPPHARTHANTQISERWLTLCCL